MNEVPSAPPPADRLRLRFPRRARVRLRRDYAHIYRVGGRARGDTILVIAAAPSTRTEGPAEARLGLSVGRRYHRHAVVRNRARRVLREAFRLARPELPALDYILIPQPPVRHLNALDVSRELKRLARRAATRYQERCATS